MVKVRFSIIVVFVVLFALVLVPFIESKSDASDINSGNSLNDLNSNSNSKIKISKSIEDKFNSQSEIDVIIIFDYDSVSKNNVGRNDVERYNLGKISSSTSSKSSKDSKDYSKLELSASSIQGFKKKDMLESVNGYSGTLTREGYDALISDLENNPDNNLNINSNIRIFEDKILTVHSALSVGVATVGANYSRNTLGLTGLGVKVGIIDTGIEYTHPDLGGCYGNNTNSSCRVFGGYDFVNSDYDPMDDNNYGHGTHVAGILGAYGTIIGVAPNATLYALKACNSGGSCSTSNVINSIDWAINNSLDVLSISLGSYASYEDEGNTGKDPLSIAVDDAVNSGIVVVLSSGNNGPGVSTVNTPGAAELAITVGATRDFDTATHTDDSVWEESSLGPAAFGRLDPELVAPGYQIVSTALGDYYALTGTSMAVPFVSGSAALLLEKYPSLSPSDVRRILIQSTNNISGKLFQIGTGELDVSKALQYNVSAIVSGQNSYGETVSNDRWEFIVTPYTVETANITIINHNSYNLSFNIILENITNLENNNTLNTSQLSIQSLVNVTNNSNYTFQVNFTLTNFSSIYPTTYGGIILLNGSGNNGSQNVSKTIRIPIVITIPILNKGYFTRTMYNDPDGNGGYINSQPTHEDVYYYCYYSTNPINMSVSINWSNSSNWLALFLNNKTADFISSAKGSGVNSQSILSSNSNNFKWIRIDGYDFVAPMTFTLNVTNPSNRVPSVLNVTAINGSINSSNILMFYTPNNITINISYNDLDNDTTNISINDSGYTLLYTNISGTNRTSVYTKSYNSSQSSNTSVIITISDIYDTSITSTITILYLSPIVVNSYTSNTSTIFLGYNTIYNFTVSAVETTGGTLYYFWNVNGNLNSTNQNYTFNSTLFNSSQNNLTLLITNSDSSNSTNRSIFWDVRVDSSNPVVNITSPMNLVYNDSIIRFNFTASDSSSGIDDCWYFVNGSFNSTNITLSSCANTTLYFSNGVYTINLFANDSTSNIANSSVLFTINDTIEPQILNTSPTGTLESTSSVVLNVNTSENATCRFDNVDSNYSSMSSTLSNFTIVHNASYSVSAGSYLLYVRCLDMNNNSNNASSYINFTVNASTGGGGGGGGDSGGGSGGSGGGGSGGSSGGGFSGIYSSSAIVGSIHGSANASFNNANIPVDNVEINSESNYSNVSVRVDKLSSLTSIAPPSNETVVNSYLNISQKNIPENDTILIRIYFNVKQDWLIQRNVSENDIILLKYNPENQNWVNLTTDMLYEDNESVYYVATSDGVGLYAIAYENKTGGDGLVIITPKVEENKTLNKSSEPQVHSDNAIASNSSSSNSTILPTSISDLIETQMKWVAFVIIGSFVLLTAVGLIIRAKNGSGPKNFEHDIIVSTNQEVRHLGVINNIYRGNIPTNNNINYSRSSSYANRQYPGQTPRQNIQYGSYTSRNQYNPYNQNNANNNNISNGQNSKPQNNSQNNILNNDTSKVNDSSKMNESNRNNTNVLFNQNNFKKK